jgi:hypothetical protein
MFLGVLIRPPLMVFGFLAAMALLEGLGRVIGQIFSVFGFAVLEESFLGISGFMAFAVILGLIVITAVWKLFGLVNYFPERILSWIGESGQHFGEKEEARAVSVNYKEAGSVSTRILNPLSTPEKAIKPVLPRKKEDAS